MPEGNLETARDLFDAVAQQDLPRLIEMTHPDVEWHSFFALGEEGGVYRGHSGLQRYVSDLRDAWEMVSPEIEGGVSVGSVVVLVGRVRYRGRGSGAESESQSGWTLKFRDRKVVSFRAFRDPERVLEAAGLPE